MELTEAEVRWAQTDWVGAADHEDADDESGFSETSEPATCGILDLFEDLVITICRCRLGTLMMNDILSACNRERRSASTASQP